MRHILFLEIFILSALATTTYANTYAVSIHNDEISEAYTANMTTGSLTIMRGSKTIVIDEIVGYTGQAARSLVSFNGGPALTYENSGSNTHFEVFYTLTLNESGPVIDCIYGNIRNGQNGASIPKAVCNLQKTLTNDYQDLIFSYSDAWIEESNKTSLQSVMAEPAEVAVAPLGQLGSVFVGLRYDSADDLMSATPKTIATVGEKTHIVTRGNAYLVYDYNNATAFSLDIETDPVTHSLKRLTPTELYKSIGHTDTFRSQ
ncbi:hypothetical protein [Stutzerimonas stutzeri]|uniref:hypothetical protein n=1 Tax=Stutzerimonas stutzeri TaxID=316 RepID=UPI000380282F|nr:hypothetical protein [Stutzerimonas stutzeri]